MACNIPIVSTNVGDVETIIGKTKGCYVTTFDEQNISNALSEAINFNMRTSGRDNISHLRIDKVAHQIKKIYTDILTR